MIALILRRRPRIECGISPVIVAGRHRRPARFRDCQRIATLLLDEAWIQESGHRSAGSRAEPACAAPDPAYPVVGRPAGNRSRNSSARHDRRYRPSNLPLLKMCSRRRMSRLNPAASWRADHVGIALGNVRDHLVHTEVIEAVVQHQNFGIPRKTSAAVFQFADEDWSELAASISPVEVHDADSPTGTGSCAGEHAYRRCRRRVRGH